MRYPQSLAKGISFALLAGFIFSMLSVTAKLAVDRVPVTMVICFRQLFGFLTMLPFVLGWVHRRGWKFLKTSRLSTHLWRTVFGLVTMYLLVTAFWLIPLSDAVLLSYTRPLFVPLIVWIWMRKRIEGLVWVGIVVAFVGIVFILKPEGHYRFDLGTIIGLLSGITGAAAVLAVRRLGKYEPAPRAVSYYLFLGFFISLVPMLFTWETPTWEGWAALVALGVIAAGYQTCLTLAYRNARATLVSCVLYTAVLFTLFWDWMIWDRIPDWWSVAGMVLVVIGAICAIGGRKARFAPGEQPMRRK